MSKKPERQPKNCVVTNNGGEIPVDSLLKKGIDEMSVEIVNLVNALLEGTGDGVMVDKETLVMSYPAGSTIRFYAINESGHEIILKGTVRGVIPPELVYDLGTGEFVVEREACLDVMTDDGNKYGIGIRVIIQPNQA